MMARAMLAEQLFRATSILANHPYHREDDAGRPLPHSNLGGGDGGKRADPDPGPVVGRAIGQCKADAKTAADRLAKLEAAAAKANNEAERLQREQLAAAAAIEEAEARISSAQAEWRAAEAQRKLAEAALAERRAPLAAY